MKVEDIARSHYPDLNATVNEIDEPRSTATPNEVNRGGKKSFKKVGGVQGKCQTQTKDPHQHEMISEPCQKTDLSIKIKLDTGTFG